MKITPLADLHGNLPLIPDSDLFLLAGDYVSPTMCDVQAQLDCFNGPFHDWLKDVAERMPVVLVAGNHDKAFETHLHLINLPENVHYLCESSVEVGGLKIWGSPYTLAFMDMAFNRRQDQMIWSIPSGTDIVLVHQPPFGVADIVDGVHIGCHGLRAALLEIGPKLVVCGHLHGNHGIHQLGNTVVISASMVDDHYRLTWAATAWSLEINRSTNSIGTESGSTWSNSSVS